MNNKDTQNSDNQEKLSTSPSSIRKTLDSIIQKIESVLARELLEQAMKDFSNLQKEWDELITPDLENDADLVNHYVKACDNFIQQRDWALWANYKKKEEICSNLAALYEETLSQTSVDRFSALRSEWKNTGPVPDKKRNKLWKKYRTLCKQLYEKNIEFFQVKEKEKEENYKLKEALCQEIEALLEPDNWTDAAEFVIKIQKGWDAIGPVPKEKSDELWDRFQKACRIFFEKRKEYYADIRKKQQEHLLKKRELCERVESLKDSTQWKETSTEIQHIQKEWGSIGPAPRQKEKILWNRFRAACDYFFDAQKRYFDEMEKDRPENLKKKEDLCALVEALDDLPEKDQYQTIIDAQNQWKLIGPVPKGMEKKLWQRFRKPIDAFFKKKDNQRENTKKTWEEHKHEKEILCEEAEALSQSTDWRNTADKMKELQRKWKQIGPAGSPDEKVLWQRFRSACDAFFERFHDHMDSVSKDQEENLAKKLDLCIQAEMIAEIELTKEQQDERAHWQLKKLSENFWFKPLDSSAKWEDRVQKIIELQKEWKTIGPVPRNKSDQLWKRFQKACNTFFDNRGKKDSHSH